MKKIKLLFWLTTGLVFLFDTLMPALTSHTELAKEGIRHLGYPDYFRIQLTVFKILGGMVLILPAIKGRLKEWAYAGFAISYISACIGHWVVDGPGVQTFFPLVMLAILVVSYLAYHRLQAGTQPQKEYHVLVNA